MDHHVLRFPFASAVTILAFGGIQSMRIDPDKIDERIHKLQEIKRIASDPELVQMLFEFIDLDDNRMERPRRINPVSDVNRAASASDEAGDLINRVARSIGAS